jgi:pimeloyl-ACP methyl ester carboxylesterase
VRFFQTLLPAALAHAIDSSSAKTFSHFSQAVLTGSFSQYDYGLMENMKRYGSSTPPNYNWRNVNVPVLLFWGNNDNIIVPQVINLLDTCTLFNVSLLRLNFTYQFYI